MLECGDLQCMCLFAKLLGWKNFFSAKGTVSPSFPIVKSFQLAMLRPLSISSLPTTEGHSQITILPTTPSTGTASACSPPLTAVSGFNTLQPTSWWTIGSLGRKEKHLRVGEGGVELPQDLTTVPLFSSCNLHVPFSSHTIFTNKSTCDVSCKILLSAPMNFAANLAFCHLLWIQPIPLALNLQLNSEKGLFRENDQTDCYVMWPLWHPLFRVIEQERYF